MPFSHLCSSVVNYREEAVLTTAIVFVKNTFASPVHIPVLSTDNLIEEVARIRCTTYNEIFSDEIVPAERKFFSQIRHLVEEGRSMIIDRTNLRVKSRDRVLDLIPKEYVKIAYVMGNFSIDLFDKRNTRPGKIIPRGVVEDMIKNFQYPTKDEGFDLIYDIDVKKGLTL